MSHLKMTAAPRVKVAMKSYQFAAQEIDEEQQETDAWYAESAASKGTFLAMLMVNGVSLADVYTKFDTDDRFFYTMCGVFPVDGDPDGTELNTRWRFFTDNKFDLTIFEQLGHEEFDSFTILKHPLGFKNFWDALHRVYDGEVDPTTINIDFTQDFENDDEGFEADLGDDYRRLCRIAKLYPRV